MAGIPSEYREMISAFVQQLGAEVDLRKAAESARDEFRLALDKTSLELKTEREARVLAEAELMPFKSTAQAERDRADRFAAELKAEVERRQLSDARAMDAEDRVVKEAMKCAAAERKLADMTGQLAQKSAEADSLRTQRPKLSIPKPEPTPVKAVNVDFKLDGAGRIRGAVMTPA